MTGMTRAPTEATPSIIRPATTNDLPRRSATMSLLHEDLARARWRDVERQALRSGQAARLVAARKWQRRAENASRRARLALAAVH
jgi:hypothetical protein